jgi:hypothetical protein
MGGQAKFQYKKANAYAYHKKSADTTIAEEARNNNANVELIKNSVNTPDAAVVIENDAYTEARVEAKGENLANMNINEHKNFSADTKEGLEQAETGEPPSQ